jgi:hypothetical protein
MYKNTELLYKYARAFYWKFHLWFHLPARSFWAAGAIFPVFPHRGGNERPL